LFSGEVELEPNYIMKECKHGTFILNAYDMDISEHMRLYGEWAESELELFTQIIKEGDIVLDVGANIGAFTVPLAKKVGSRGRVHAFEPQALINQRLNANLVINGLENVHVYHAAVGNHAGKISVPQLNYSVDSNFGGLSLAAPIAGQTNEWSYSVTLLTLDSINFYNPYTGKDCPTFIKMDVEMMEKSVLEGAVNLLQRCKPMIHAENNHENTTAALVEQLYSMDYVPFWDIKANYNPKFQGIVPDITNGYHNMNMLCIPRTRLMSEGGDVSTIGFVRVERDKPYLGQYFLQAQPDGTMQPMFRQHST
jgi:FkbM family methyltransferase